MGSLSGMLKCALVFCLLAQASLGLVRPVVRPAPKLRDPQSDEYIDKILENLRNLIQEQNMDPMTLPDLETGFSDTILGITWHGSAKLRNGRFSGLSTIARTGDTSFTVEGDTARLTAYIGLGGTRAHYDASAEFMGISVGASVTADIESITIYLDATMKLEEGATLQLQNFHISNLGHIRVDVGGLGPLDWILEILVDFVDSFLKDWIVDLVEGPLKDLIQSLLDQFPIDFGRFI